MEDNLYIMELAKISRAKAYKLIRDCNKELQAQGYFVISGKTPRSYLFKRLGITE